MLTVSSTRCNMEARLGSRMAYKTLSPIHMIKGMAHVQAWSSQNDMSRQSASHRIQVQTLIRAAFQWGTPSRGPLV